MPIIVFGSPKGGCGKSTASVILGTELAAGGAKVIFIDADPNQSLTTWSKAGQIPENITVISSDTVKERLAGKGGKIPEGFDEIIASYYQPNSVVIVDLEGIADQEMTDAIAVADLVIAPMNATKLDLGGVLKMIAQIKRVERLTKRSITSTVLMNSIRPGGVMGTMHRQILQALDTNKINHLKQGLVRRDAYANLFHEGGNLRTLEAKGNGNLESAIKEATTFAEEVFSYIMSKKDAAE